ncbi:MAG TPA: hypothetical protein VEU96_00580 [Bryobacteraceae bacterium]|nr:hypothetical protein [Bryobacteraceae bacterium]
MRADEGIPSLDSLEIVPRSDALSFGVLSSLVDAQAFSPSVRAFSILHQAIYLRARRMVGTRTSPSSLRQDVLERNRSRAVSDGLQARFEPGFKLASTAFLDLVESLREELQVLEVEIEELAPVLLGVHLRSLGYGALQTENELLQETVRTSIRAQRPPEEGLAELIARAGLRDVLLERNQQSYKAATSELMAWWESWLKSSAPEIRHKPSRPPIDRHAERGHGKGSRPGGHRFSNRESKPGEILLELFDQTRHRVASIPERVALLRSFRSRAATVNLGLAMSQIPSGRRAAIASWIGPNSGKVRAFTPDSRFWGNPLAAEPLAQCRNTGMALMAVEVQQRDERQLQDWLSELRKQLPAGIEMLNWARPTFQGKLRQELILIGIGEDGK